MKILIVGGVAGGATAAARLRRLDEHAEIILFEKGEYISYANCGLPYYIGDVIKDRERLLVQTPESMRARFGFDIRIRSEVTAIDRAARTVTVLDHESGRTYAESYDKLILSPGAEPKRPAMEGIDLPGIHTLRTIPDTDRIRAVVDTQNPRSAVIIGGGFIGVEMAENLRDRGLDVTIVEFTDQLVASLDRDMAVFLHAHARRHGLRLLFNTGAAGFSRTEDGRLSVRLTTGDVLVTDMVIMSIGISPENRLAREAGLELGFGGGIKVDEFLFTSDPHILAVGDAIEIRSLVSGQPGLIPLAGPANKQGRIAAENALGGRVPFDGVQGTAVLKVFDMTAASTGLNEKQLTRAGIAYEKTYIHPLNHAGYYPGATQLSLKMLFDPEKGTILGAQGVGIDGVEKRIDVLATVQRLGGTVFDLEKLELAYAPPYSSAKDPVNMLGFTAANILKDDVKVFHHHDVAGLDLSQVTLLDVRSAEEFELGSIPQSVNIDVDELRERLDEIPKDRPVYLFCQVGLRGYVAARILQQNGFRAVYNLSGGYKHYQMQRDEEAAAIPFDCLGNACSTAVASSECGTALGDTAAGNATGDVAGEGERLAVPARASAAASVGRSAAASCPLDEGRTIRVDATGLQCPGPILKLAEGMRQAEVNDTILIESTDPGFASDIGVWCERTGHTLLQNDRDGVVCRAAIRKSAARPVETSAAQSHDKALIVFSGDLDKALAAMIIANGAASMGRPVTLFFTFWGLNVLRRSDRVPVRKNIVENMFGFMMPRGSRRLALSKMHMAGAGTQMMRAIMKAKNISSLEELIETAIAQGVRIVACQMSMDVMGLKPEELIPGVEIGGVASFIGAAERADTTLFI